MSEYSYKASKGRAYVHQSNDGSPTTDASGYVQFVGDGGNLYTDVDTLGADDVTVYVEDDGSAVVGYTIHEVTRTGKDVAGGTTGSTAGTSADTPDRTQVTDFGGSLLRVEITSNESALEYVEVVTK